MEANEPKKEQNTEEMDVMKQFMELLGQQGMKEQSQDFMEVLQYIAGMQLQLSAMVDELQGVRKQLERMQESQPKAAESQLLDRTANKGIVLSDFDTDSSNFIWKYYCPALDSGER